MSARRWVGVAGGLLLVAAWIGPLPGWSGHSFTAHMVLHMTVVAVAAGLVAVGWTGSRLDPARRWPGLVSPLPASAAELVVVWVWHAPALHHAARAFPEVFALEQASFLAVGLYLWSAALGGPPELSRSRAVAGVAGLLVTAMHMTLLGALLGLAPRTLYTHAGDSLFGLSALEDQQLGGVVMLLVGGLAYLAGGLWLTAGVLRRSVPAGEERI